MRPPSKWQVVKFKLQAVWATLQHPLLVQFFFFLFLQGIVMPEYQDFDYFFAIDHLGITNETISYQSIYSGTFIFFMPLLYQALFINSEYKNLMTAS